jgi:probable rRNA maturation factor
VIDVEVLGAPLAAEHLTRAQVRELCVLTAEQRGVASGHVAVHFVHAPRIAQLNAQHRGRAEPTDVLSFPVDGVEPLNEDATRELGDILICPEHTTDVREAIVHGMLHLLGMDHESDDGEMLALQSELLALAAHKPSRSRRPPAGVLANATRNRRRNDT